MSIAVTQAKIRLPERFLNKVDFDGPVMPGMKTPCWVWTGANDRGYGRYWLDGTSTPAHKVALSILVGPIPPGTEVHHRCENPPCVRPSHLRSMVRLDHVRISTNATKTHCKHGHPLSGDNLYANKNGYRVCKKCVDRNQREYYARKRVAA